MWRDGEAGKSTGFVGAQVASAGHASARPVEQERFNEEFSLVHEDFCGTSWLTVTDIGVRDGRFMLNTRGPDGLTYGIERFSETTDRDQPGHR